MMEEKLLAQLKDINNYTNPNYPLILGIVHSTQSSNEIVKEITEMLQHNFKKTQSILGEKITSLVLECNKDLN